MIKLATGHFFLLNLRNHGISHLTMADQSGTRKKEHDMHAMKRSTFNELRVGEPKGRKVILAKVAPPGTKRELIFHSGKKRRTPPDCISYPLRNRT